MAQRPYRLLGLPETRSLIFLIKNSPDQAEGYLDYLQPRDVFQHGADVVMAEWRCNHENALFESAYLAEDWDNGSFHAGAGEIREIQIITSATSPSSEASGPRIPWSISS
jgi:hypothetical protein